MDWAASCVVPEAWRNLAESAEARQSLMGSSINWLELMMTELYIGVGCQLPQHLPYLVLRYSIECTASRPIRVEPLYSSNVDIPAPQNPRNRPKTPFSFQRFTIPQIRGFQGRAMYVDSDMLVFQDAAPLFERPFGEANVLAVPHESSMMVLDCARLDWRIDRLVEELDAERLSYDGLMSCRRVANIAYTIPPIWNWLDNAQKFPPKDVAIVHYTLTTSQPWLTAGNPLGHLWLQTLLNAIDAGSIRIADVEEAVDRGFVRPSLRYQVKERVTTKEAIPRDVLRADQAFAEYCRSVNYAIVDGFR